MGCVNDRFTQNHKQKPQTTRANQSSRGASSIQQKEPHVITMPNQEVSKQACGYQFGESNKTTMAVQQQKKEGAIDEMLQFYRQCKHYYEEHDIDRANDYSIMFEKKFEQYASSVQASDVILQTKEEYFKLIRQVQEEYQDVISYDAEVKKGGWVEKSNKKGVKISTRREQNTVGTLVQAEIDQPFEILISILIEMDLYKNFMPFMKVSRQQKIVARNCRIGYTENHIPFLSVREAFMQGIGYNRLHKDKTLFLYTRSIHNRPDLQEKLGYKCEVNGEYIQLVYKYFLLKYTPIERGKGLISLAMNVDTKLDFLPMWIQDKISEDFGNDFFKNILKLSKKYKGSEWERNVEKNPALFNFFKNAVDEYLEGHSKMEK